MAELLFEFSATFVLGALLGAMLLYSFAKVYGMTPKKSRRHMEFRFKDRELVGACPQARRSLSVEDLDQDIYAQLINRLSVVFPSLSQRLEDSTRHHATFTLSEATHSGPAALHVDANGSTVKLQLSGIEAPLSQKTLMDTEQATAMSAELVSLRATTDAAPYLSWREASDGTVTWASSSYTQLAEISDVPDATTSWPPPRLFHGGPITATGEAAQLKRATLTLKSGEQKTYEVSRFGDDTGTVNYAMDVGATVSAEESLRCFVQTLTQTFAALPIGLAVFDRSRSLVMFNPALMDLTNLEASWLTARPTLYDFINQMREKRMLPERRDFADWRKKITELEESAAEGTYCETWALPTGQTYRITGRPHPEGAVAFLLEDITAEMSLTRKFRRELSMNQTLLDHLPEALAVFGDDGIITMTNAAYHALWETDPEDALSQLTITDATRLWQENSSPNPMWGDARDFVAQRGERSDWSDTATLSNGVLITCNFQPLTGGATLISFSPSHQLNSPPTQSPPKAKQLASVSS